MSQVRIWNFGDTLTHEKIAIVNEKLFSPGIYEGYDVEIIDAQSFELYNAADPTGEVGYLLLPDGIILSETARVRFEFTVMPALETAYTIVARHTDVNQFGGNAATYALLDGIIAPENADGTVIAWIRHPGSGAPFADFMIQLPPKMTAVAFSDYLSHHSADPFPGTDNSFVVDNDAHHIVSNATTSLSPLQTGADWICRQIFADGGTPAPAPTTRILAQLPIKAKPTRIDVVAYIDVACELRVVAFDEDDVQADSTPNSFVPPAAPEWQKLSIAIPPYKLVGVDYVANGKWTEGKFWRFEVQFDVAQLKTCKLAQVVVHYE